MDIKKEDGDPVIQDAASKNSASTRTMNGGVNASAPSGNSEAPPEKLLSSCGSPKKNAQPQLLNIKKQSSDFESADSSFASNAMEPDGTASTSSFVTSTNGISSSVISAKDAKGNHDGGERVNGIGASPNDSSVLGTFRSVIPQAVFEKIKDRISASREREKVSVAKQILRKEEERRRLARDRDAEDLDSKIQDLKEKIKQEKARRQLIFAQTKEKMSLETRCKMEMAAREREREMQTNHVQHSYPNPTMLISQTNPSMQRPRLMNYPLVNVPVPANLQLLHPDGSHMNNAHSANSTKRHRSPSPAHMAGSSSMMDRSGSSRSSHHEPSHSRSHLQPPSNKQSRSNNQGSTPDLHQSSSQSSRGNPSGMRSPNKSQTPVQQNVQSQQQSNVAQQGQMTMAPFAMAAPYPAAMGNQVVMVVPNMAGGGGQPQLMSINPALLGKAPEHMQALTPQQQQALMAQQLHAMGGLTTLNPEYFQRALQQHFSDQQRMNANAGALQDVYRQYAAAGMMPQPMLVRTGVPQMAQMSQQSNPQSSSSQPSSHSHQSSNAQSAHNSGSSHPNDGSQRVGSIMTGIPVFGPAMGHPGQSYGLPPSGSSMSNSHPSNMYPRSGSSS